MLPKIQHPLFDETIPSTGQKIKFRPMTVKEEKILLMAKQSGERVDMLNSIIQVVGNCIEAEKIDVNKLSLCDVEYLFTKIRSQSVSNIVKVTYIDSEDNESRTFDVDLNAVVATPGPKTNKIDLGGETYMTLKLPPITLYTQKDFLDASDTQVFEMLMLNSMDRIYEGDRVHVCAESTSEEIKEFTESLSSKTYTQIQTFFSQIPHLEYVIKYTNNQKHERVIVLKGLEDFFVFG